MVDKVFGCRKGTCGLTVGLALSGVVIGLLLIEVPVVYVLAALGAAGVVAGACYKPELSILAMVVIISSILWEEDLPLIPLGPGSLHVTDILMLVLFSMAMVKRFTKRREMKSRSPLEKILALFMLSTTLSAVLSLVYFGLDFNNVTRLYRLICYYLIFYIITNLITTKRQIRFIIEGLFIVAALVAIAMLAQTIVGESVQILPEKTIVKASGLEEELNSIRMNPPGQTLVYITFVTALCFAVYQRGRSLFLSRYCFLLVALGAGVMLTYNRSYLVSIMVSLAVLLAVAGAGERKRLASLLAGSAVLIMAVALVSWGGNEKLRGTFEAVSQRYLTLFAGKNLVESNSLNDRKLENGYAVQKIADSPLLGSGLSSDYRPAIYGPDDEITYYVHNVYLWLILDLGLPGFALFLWFYLAFIVRAWKYSGRYQDPYLKSVATGAMLAGIGMLPMALVIPLFLEWHSVVAIVIFIGLSETMIENKLYQSQDVTV